MNKRESLLITLGIVFIAFNLRAPITSVGSVVEMIQAQYSLSGVAAGLITTLPLIAFAIVSPFVAEFSRKYGFKKSMLGALFFIIAGELIRSYTNSIGLFVGTALLGVGIAVGNVLIPSIIKMKFPTKLGRMTGIYISSMCLFAAIGAGTSVPLAKGLNLGWGNALAVWVIVALATLVIWVILPNKQMSIEATTQNNSNSKRPSIWGSSIAWWVTLFMGVQSLVFYALVAWLPTIVISKGMSAAFAGTMALTYQLVAIPITLMVPLLCDKFKNQRGIVMITCALYLVGLILFLYAETETLMFISVLLMSLSMGGCISVSIAFISLRSSNALRASELSGMTQSAGYLLAAVGPILMGLLYDKLQSWTVPIIIFCVLILTLAFTGYFAGNNVVIEED